MKKIRFKKDIECRLTVKVDGEAVSLESSELTLVLIRPDRTRVRVAIESVEENVLHFYITPIMQNKVGVYNLELWRDVGSGHQTICDVPNAFRLVPLSQQEGGESKDNLETGTVGVTANFTGEYIVIDSLDSYSTDAALSANQGRILNDKISGLGDSLDEETEAREKADTELGEAITSEAEARSDADTKLQEAIDAEAEARSDADTKLQEA
ncbi:MAG: hypothetical protein LUD72_07130, partial [Bacteroidales bacterium]|nr:hypothetical protein [Bacteroidales bacterium]